MKQNFLEYETVEGANTVNLNEYTFIGFHMNSYAFKIRQAKEKGVKNGTNKQDNKRD